MTSVGARPRLVNGFALYGWSSFLIHDLQPGERVLDLRAVARSAAIFVGVVAAPIGARMAGLSWGLAAGAAVVAAIVGFVVGTVAGRLLFPAPPGEAVVVRWGRPSLGIALKASVCSGVIVAAAIAVAAAPAGGIAAAGASLLVGVVIAVGVGCGAALL